MGLDVFSERSEPKVRVLTEEEKAVANEEWMQMYNQLKDFREKNGHSLPNQRKPRTPLYNWVDRQRNQYKKLLKGKKTDMTPQRVRYLNAIQFPLLPSRQKISWDDRYEELKSYKAKYGNIVVPRSYPGRLYIVHRHLDFLFTDNSFILTVWFLFHFNMFTKGQLGKL